MTENQADATIVAALVQDEDRLAFLPKYFGSYFTSGESLVFTWMGRMDSEYSGGYWDFFELSNGGFYMALKRDNNIKILLSTGHVMREVSADAAGIVVTLYAISYLMNIEYEKALSPKQEASLKCVYDHYYQLRDYAAEHPEAEAIFALID